MLIVKTSSPIFKRLILGVSWIGLLRISTRIIAFVKIFIIARLLSPSQFGLFGIAVLVLSILEVLTEPGINVFFIQKEGKIKKYINSAWVLSIARGFFLGILIFLLIPFTIYFFNISESKEEYESVLKLLALIPFIKGFINPAVIKFLQDLDFKKEFAFRFVVFFVDAGITIISAIINPHPVSLVHGLIAGALVETILSFQLIKPRPKFLFSMSKAKHILARGKWVTIHGISEFIYKNIDDLFITKALGPYYLGIYQIAYKIAVMPISEVADVFGKVSFPVFANISNRNKNVFRGIITKIVLITFAFLLPIIILVQLYAQQIVIFVLGDQWLPSVLVIKVLIFYSLIKSLMNPILTYILAVKKQEYLAYISLLNMFVMASFLIPLGYRFGVLGVAWSVVISSFFSMPFGIYLFLKIRR